MTDRSCGLRLRLAAGAVGDRDGAIPTFRSSLAPALTVVTLLVLGAGFMTKLLLPPWSVFWDHRQTKSG